MSEPRNAEPLRVSSRSSASLRREMVAALEGAGAARTVPVRRAFQAVPREMFVPEIAARDGLPAIYRPELGLDRPLRRMNSHATVRSGCGALSTLSVAPRLVGR